MIGDELTNITQKDYSSMVQKASPKSRILKNCLNAFWVGGAICTFAQGLTDFYGSALGYDLKDARCLTSLTLIFIAALLTALSLYDNIAKFAGAGTLVPITGFANSVAAPAIEFRSEGLILGLGAKTFAIAGPVIVYGTACSILYGLILSLQRAF